MIELFNKSGVIEILTPGKNIISFDTCSKEVKIDDLNVVHPWEFEKSGILLEVKEYSNILFYSFTVDSKHLLIVSDDSFELKEEILSFFWDVDVLVMIWTVKSAKMFESIEARIVLPYGESKDTFLSNLGQHIEEVISYKIKSELPTDSTEFINLK